LAKRFLVKLFKNTTDFYRLGEVGVNCSNMIMLLKNNTHFFKNVSSITLGPVDGSRFKELKGVEFND